MNSTRCQRSDRGEAIGRSHLWGFTSQSGVAPLVRPVAHKIDYAVPQHHGSCWTWLAAHRRWVLGALAITAVVTAAWVTVEIPWLWYGSRGAYQHHKRLTYTQPPSFLVFEMTRTRRSEAAIEPRWEEDVNRSHRLSPRHPAIFPSGWKYEGCLLFMHERTGPSGHRRLVSAEYRLLDGAPSDSHGFMLGVSIRWSSESSGGSDTAPRLVAMAPALDVPLLGGSNRLYFGQPDAKDASHFTIKYEIDNVPGTIDGWLQADDTVRLETRDGPAAKPHRQ